jgi:predicted restriction endonuclease
MSSQSHARYGSAWERDELILALYLYCQIPFAKTKANNPEVDRLASLLGRTPASVARKLGNFGAFDPLLSNRGIIGLKHYGKLDELIWNEFHDNWDKLVEESRAILAAKEAPKVELLDYEPIISLPIGPTEKPRTVIVRLCQSFFRRTILSSYQNQCCVCSIDLPELLTASHIVPWSANPKTRTDPQNGLCLCAIHDRAFDKGLISVSDKLQLLVSPIIKKSRSKFIKVALSSFENRAIRPPTRFLPKSEFLTWHRKNVFRS